MSDKDQGPRETTQELAGAGSGPAPGRDRVAIRRDMFWQNVVRETLSSLAATAAMLSGRLSAGASGAAGGGAPGHEMFDGRMAVITRLGQRIPIADVYPVFACSVSSGQGTSERLLSADVQCTVFQIKTPTGEVYTLPVSEIVSLHALSESLIKRLEAMAAERAGPGGRDDSQPFGFAAFRSLAESESGLAGAGGVDEA